MERAPQFEVIDADELAARWKLPVSWIYEQTRARAEDPIPHIGFGKYVRFEWGSPELTEWLARRRKGSKYQGKGESQRKEVA